MLGKSTFVFSPPNTLQVRLVASLLLDDQQVLKTMDTGSPDRLLELRHLTAGGRIEDDDSRWSATDDQLQRSQISTGGEPDIELLIKDGSAVRQRRKHGFALWKWELASVWLSICLFVVMAVVLVRHNGHLQRQWNFPLSPNSLVAIFSTVIRVTILVPVAEGTKRPMPKVTLLRALMLLFYFSTRPAQVVLVSARETATPPRGF